MKQREVSCFTQLQSLKRPLPLIQTLNLNVESEQPSDTTGAGVGFAVGDVVVGGSVVGVIGVGGVGVGGVGVGTDGEEVLSTVVHSFGLFASYELKIPPIALAV